MLRASTFYAMHANYSTHLISFSYSQHVAHSHTPIKHHPHLQHMKVCEQKYPSTQYFDIGLPSIERTNCGEQRVTLYRSLTCIVNTLRTGLLNCLNARSRSLNFRHRASCILGQAFRYSPENAFYIFNQQIYFII